VTSSPATAAEARASTSDAVGLLDRVRPHWPLGAILGVFVLSAFIVPTLANVTVSDDWVYMRSVRILVEDGRLDIHPLVSSNLVFQVFWGALFGEVFGVTPGAMRLSIVVLWLLSGVACYGLAWELTRKHALSGLATALYLFNPLGYVLAFTFMTDAPFTALLVISTYCTVRGVRDGFDWRWLLAGSVIAAAALLVRQPGVFIPVGVLLALAATRRLPVEWHRRLLIAVEVVGPPLVAFLAYSWWATNVNGNSATASIMQDQLFLGGWYALTRQTLQLAVIQPVYLGLFALPLTLGAAAGARRLVRGISPVGWMGIVAWETLIVAGVVGMWAIGMRMPYIPHFLSPSGLGPNDLIYARWPLAGEWLFSMITVVSAASAIAAGFLIIRAFDFHRRLDPGLAVVLVTLLVQGGAVVIVSTHFRFWHYGGVLSPSLDRYLLPLVPLGIVLVAWAVRDFEVHLPLAWYAAAVLAVFAVVGTRDNLVFHEATWDLARETVASGVPLTKLDAGGSWTGYQVGEQSYAENRIGPAYPGRWWLGLYGTVIDPEYVITTIEMTGYTTVRAYRYSLWLDNRPAVLYLQHRDGPPS
jgi:4-amino-4-deoxy-L-arabinose transferase-like glycosyltransferase